MKILSYQAAKFIIQEYEDDKLYLLPISELKTQLRKMYKKYYRDKKDLQVLLSRIKLLHYLIRKHENR